MLWLTIFSRKPMADHKIIPELFWSYRELFTGDPHGKQAVIQNLKNIVSFMPIGFLIPNVFKKKKWFFTVFLGFALSALIEASQYIFKLGWCEPDDVICNTLGTFLGWVCSNKRKILLMRAQEFIRRP